MYAVLITLIKCCFFFFFLQQFNYLFYNHRFQTWATSILHGPQPMSGNTNDVKSVPKGGCNGLFIVPSIVVY